MYQIERYITTQIELQSGVFLAIASPYLPPVNVYFRQPTWVLPPTPPFEPASSC